jgi:hypothetical protein
MGSKALGTPSRQEIAGLLDSSKMHKNLVISLDFSQKIIYSNKIQTFWLSPEELSLSVRWVVTTASQLRNLRMEFLSWI